MKIDALSLICAAVLCTILTLGLWPFHSPRNEVFWFTNHDGLHFGKYGTVISSAPFQVRGPQNDSESSLEICLQPDRIWGSGTLLEFYGSGDLLEFSLRQSQTDLVLRTATQDDESRSRIAALYINGVFHRKVPVFIAITAGVSGTSIYIDGVLVAKAHRFLLSDRAFTGRLVVGDAPGQSDSWSGRLLHLAIYDRQLAATEVLHHYSTWKQTGRPEVAEDERNIALYPFDEHTGNVIRDRAGSGVDLYIPEKYQVMDKIVLEPFWAEFEMSRSYWAAALKNIVGFVPVGFLFYAYLTRLLPPKRAALVTVALGTAVSLTIEILQAFLPTRDSGTTDLITNTLGTWLGVVSLRVLYRVFRHSPDPVSRVSHNHLR